MKPKSDNLFHFTKTLDVLQLILKKGIEPRFCLEDNEWFESEVFKHLAFPMSCFCDIPLSRISEHTNFYGSYGIGLTKDWGLKNSLNPVIYAPQNGIIQNLLKYLFNNDIEGEDYNEHTFRLWSLIKPISGKMIIAGQFIEKEFYQENEWRYVPPTQHLLLDEDFEDSKEKSNKNIAKYALKFVPSDIRYIFVKTDNDIPQLVDFINNNLGMFPLNDLKILQSRIVSLETLNRDL